MHRLVLLGTLGACTGPGETDDPPVADDVALHVLPFVDTSRPTEAFTDLPASDVRALDTWVWLPAGVPEETRDRPVVLIAHGNSGHPEKFLLLAELLVDEGWVVAAPVFPATNRDGDSAGFAIPDLANQPADLDYVVAELAREAADPGSVLHERLDTDQLVAVGHSLGGATVAAWTRWGEAPRTDLAATVLLAPATFLNGMFGEGPHGEGPPVQFIHGEEDRLVPLSASEDMYGVVDDPAALVVLPGHAHSDPFEGDTDGVRTSAALILGVLDEQVDGQPGAWAAALEGAAAEGALVDARGL